MPSDTKPNALRRTLDRVEELQEQVRDLELEKAMLREALEGFVTYHGGHCALGVHLLALMGKGREALAKTTPPHRASATGSAQGHLDFEG